MSQDPEYTLPAGEWVELGPGNYFAFLDGAEPIEVEFWHDSGRLDDSVISARPGYYARPPIKGSALLGEDIAFTNVRVKSTNQQTATIVILRGEGGERRLTGTVNVINSDKTRTVAEVAFSGAVNVGGTSSNFGHVQLWNPPGSGKVAVIRKIILGVGASSLMSVKFHNSALTSDKGNPANKKAGGAASAIKLRAESHTAQRGLDPALAQMDFGSAGTTAYEFAEPIIILPGQGIIGVSDTTNVDCRATFEFFEEDA